MKKLHLLLLTGIIFLSSCNKDEIATKQPIEESFAPQLIATVAQNDITARSGVIEDNDNYTTAGEMFYWTDGDATTVFFKAASMEDPTEFMKAEYTADVAPGVKSNSCTFEAVSSNVTQGDYTAYGFFPTAAWALSADYADFLTTGLPAYQEQPDATSTHLGAYMLMKAKKDDVTVNGNDPINLNYKHLASVIRFAVSNESGNSDLKLTQINVSLNSGKSVFGTSASLDGDVDATSLRIDTWGNVSQLTLNMTGTARDFSPKDGRQQCEGYMGVLPTAADAFEASDDLLIELSLTDGDNNYTVSKSYNIDTDLDFLSGGIEQGKSYYFQMIVNGSNLILVPGRSYTVGDYWPDDINPEGIVFWVKPGSSGTRGKVVGFGEEYVECWGPEIVDEEEAGVIGIRSLTNGATATRNLILKYKNASGFDTDYPAFHYIYSAVNDNNENGVWYLPARDELRMLYAGYSGKIYESIINWTADEMPDYHSPESIAARTAFDEKLGNKGGTAFGTSENPFPTWYLSSSEITGETFYSFNFSDGAYSDDSKSTVGNIRWIREF